MAKSTNSTQFGSLRKITSEKVFNETCGSISKAGEWLDKAIQLSWNFAHEQYSKHGNATFYATLLNSVGGSRSKNYMAVLDYTKGHANVDVFVRKDKVTQKAILINGHKAYTFKKIEKGQQKVTKPAVSWTDYKRESKAHTVKPLSRLESLITTIDTAKTSGLIEGMSMRNVNALEKALKAVVVEFSNKSTAELKSVG